MKNIDILNFYSEEKKMQQLAANLKEPRERYKIENQLFELRANLANEIIEVYETLKC